MLFSNIEKKFVRNFKSKKQQIGSIQNAKKKQERKQNSLRAHQK